MTAPLFAVENLCIERDSVILQNINWRVERGQHWVILGANGSGKTSLLNALTGYLVPTRGEVRLGTARFGAADWREVRTAVGLVSASLAQRIEPNQTAHEVILSGRDAQINYWGQPSAAENARATRLLRHVRAAHLARRAWCQLSQGERQRILIGRALAARPRLLFLDEPAAGLDPVAREDFLIFLQALGRSKAGPSLVLVTHHVEEITDIFSHVLLLRQGIVLDGGERARVLNSTTLSSAFGARLKLNRAGGRYRLHVANPSNSFRN